ncbi:MAG: hypothetical protein WAK82_02610 [Streptosporangiaceae bacterium]
MPAAITAVPARADREQIKPRPDGHRRQVTLAALYYLLAALAVTLWLWRDPATRSVAGNPNDTDQLAWFLRYDATAVAHGHLPALVTTAMNAPVGVNVMWNTFMLLPGVLLAPLTLLAGPQTVLNVLLVAGFAGSATALFAVLRRWGVSGPAAVLGGAVYGFSPALLHSAIGHADLQFAVLPPLIIDAGLRLALGRSRPWRGGLLLGLLITAQLLISEELLLDTAIAAVVLTLVLAASRPRAVLGYRAPAAIKPLAGGLGAAAAVTAVVAGYPLWVQFFGPLYQSGSPFTLDWYKNDLSSLVVPSSVLLFHTRASAAEAARFQGHLPEYLGYLGWPLIVLLAAAAVACWRRLPARAVAVTAAVLLVFSLGGTLMSGGHEHHAIKLPWYWLQSLPVLSAALPDRFSIVADGMAAVLLAFAVDAAIPAVARLVSRWLPRLAVGRRPAAVVMCCAVLALLPIVPRPLPADKVTPVPAGWTTVLAALRLPASAPVLVVPLPMSTFTEPLRWQADSGEPRSLVGGYFMGPNASGRGYIDGTGTPPAALYLNAVWLRSSQGLPTALAGNVPPSAYRGNPRYIQIRKVTDARMRQQIRTWRVSAVVAVTRPGSPLARYLTALLGHPAATAGDVVAWRIHHT